MTNGGSHKPVKADKNKPAKPATASKPDLEEEGLTALNWAIGLSISQYRPH
jgi:hypothetical protein